MNQIHFSEVRWLVDFQQRSSLQSTKLQSKPTNHANEPQKLLNITGIVTPWCVGSARLAQEAKAAPIKFICGRTLNFADNGRDENGPKNSTTDQSRPSLHYLVQNAFRQIARHN